MNCGARDPDGQADGPVDAVDRQEGEAVGAEELTHALEVLVGGQQVDFVRRIDAVIVGMIIGGEAMRMCTSRAPASYISCTIFFEVVPRTTLSSTSTMRLPRMTLALAECLSLTPSARMRCEGSIKVRPT